MTDRTEAFVSARWLRRQGSPAALLSLPSAAADALRTELLASSSASQSGATADGSSDAPSASAAWVRTRKSVAFLSWSRRKPTFPSADADQATKNTAKQ